MVAEMDKLKTMVRKTEDRQQLGELMALVAEKTTVAVAVKPDRTDSKVTPLSSAKPHCIYAECAWCWWLSTTVALAAKPGRTDSKVQHEELS